VIIKRSPALAAVVEEALWIAAGNLAAAERFICAVERTLKTLEFMPHCGRLYLRADDRLQGMRMQSVRGFPHHLIFYRPLSNGIEFVWLVHTARDIVRAMQRVGLI
jgi:plasmid stabilization system protein ParE